MDLSIVSGTYNRINYLQKMVESARQSLSGSYGLEHEFVIVDGGSVDGSQKWCKQQDDIRLIEQGQLLGAVKAFNEGAFASGGEYVLLANDDILFLGDSILRAYIYMQRYTDCGIGCFFQDRDRQYMDDSNPDKWKVEGMPAVYNNEQVWRPYGQVCLVLKWLGDKVGWWGDYLHTYGGDNELSSWVYEYGYKVSPVPLTKIHDEAPNDGLRKINNISGARDPKAVKGHHPDSWAWGRKWRDHSTGLVGGVIKDKPTMVNTVETRERIVYLPIYEQGWDIQKEQKHGLRDALSKVGIVSEFDYLGINASVGHDQMIQELHKVCGVMQPTIVLTQIHNPDPITVADIERLMNSYPDSLFVNWNGDVWPDNLISEEGLELAGVFDLQTTVNRDVLEKYHAEGINAAYWQIGWEPDGVGHNGGPEHEVVFLASGYSSKRQQLVKQLKSMKWNLGLYGQGWPEAQGQNLYNFIEACKIYRGAKISLGDSQWPETGFVSNRIFQALAAGGSALAHQWFRDMEHLGLIDGENIIVWKTFDELAKKIDYYLTHEDERKRIAEAGERLALERHSFDTRVAELMTMIGKPDEIETDGWRW